MLQPVTLEWKEGGTCFPGEALNLTKYRVEGVNFSCVQLQYRPQLEGILYAGGCCGSLAAYLSGALWLVNSPIENYVAFS